MALLYPIGLLAMAGLIIPVLLHLWSVKKGKTLKIGSIALLGENSTASSRSLRLTDLLLFALRCLIVILTSLILAQPYFNKVNIVTNRNGWILIDKTSFTKVYNTNRPTIDSLLNLGFEMHDFNLDFKQFFLKDSLIADPEKANLSLSYNALINQLNKEIPSGYSAYLFADRRLKNFDGVLVKPNFHLVWRNTQTSDTLKTWSSSFIGKVYQATSSPLLTTYESSAQELPKIKVEIYSPSSNDAKYVKAALNAISDFSKREIEVSNWEVGAESKADVVFWLSTEPVSSAIRSDATVFSYRKGKILPMHSSLQIGSGNDRDLALYKRVELDRIIGFPMWIDGFGDPILIKETQATAARFYFYSRLNPQWTDLVWDEQFVSALMPIVLNTQSTANFGFEDHPEDQRVLKQEPVIVSKANLLSPITALTKHSLALPIWIIIGILLLIERILSFRNKSNFANVRG